MTNTNRIPNGTLVTLPDGTTARAYAETGKLGTDSPGFCGRYRTVDANGREDTGWTRDQLTVVGYRIERQVGPAGRIAWVGVTR